jgi:hypothetical protein
LSFKAFARRRDRIFRAGPDVDRRRGAAGSLCADAHGSASRPSTIRPIDSERRFADFELRNQRIVRSGSQPHMSTDAPPDVAGLSLTGSAPVVISAAENKALCESLGTQPAANGEAHPSYYYTATQVGMGLTVAALCEKCGFNVDDGPMLASSEAEFFGRLMTDTPYRVQGAVTSLTRKNSRKLGVMDLLDYRLRLIDPHGNAVLETRNLWVLPRGPS